MVRRLRDREVGSASGSAPDYRPPDTLHSRSHFGYCTERCRDTTIDHRPSGSLSDRRGTSAAAAATAAAAAVERGGVVTRKRGGGPRHSSFTRNLSVAFFAPPANAMPRSGMLRRVLEALYIIGSLGSVRSGGCEPRVYNWSRIPRRILRRMYRVFGSSRPKGNLWFPELRDLPNKTSSGPLIGAFEFTTSKNPHDLDFYASIFIILV